MQKRIMSVALLTTCSIAFTGCGIQKGIPSAAYFTTQLHATGSCCTKDSTTDTQQLLTTADFESTAALLKNNLAKMRMIIAAAKKAGNDDAKWEQVNHRLDDLQTEQQTLKKNIQNVSPKQRLELYSDIREYMNILEDFFKYTKHSQEKVLEEYHSIATLGVLSCKILKAGLRIQNIIDHMRVFL